jgi:hypothetical protein
MGMITALVSAENHVAVEYVDYHLTRIEDLATVFDIILPEADDSARD